MKVELWPIGKVIPYPKNARRIPERAIAKVADSIRTFGWRQPIVVDRKGVIVVGHVRLLAGQALKAERVPVHVATDLSEEQIRLYRLADNRTHDETTWDLEVLGVELGELQAMGVELAGSAFEGIELDRLTRTEEETEAADAVIEPPKTPVSRAGDFWRLGKHRLLCGDCTSKENVARLCGKDAPLLLVTDPPYGIELDSEWRDRAGLNTHGQAAGSYMKQRSEGHHNTTISSDTRADWSEAFELHPSLQVAYVWHASKFTREVLDGLLRVGFVHHQQIIWNKGRTVLTRTHYWFQHEPCWYVRKKNAPWFGKAGENSSVWDAISPKFIMGGSDETKYDHPTQKPIALMLKPIVNHTKAGDVVFDCFLGSGTTMMAAEQADRACLGFELDPRFVDVIVTRWQELTGKVAKTVEGKTFEELRTERAKHNRKKNPAKQ